MSVGENDVVNNHSAIMFSGTKTYTINHIDIYHDWSSNYMC